MRLGFEASSFVTGESFVKSTSDFRFLPLDIFCLGWTTVTSGGSILILLLGFFSSFDDLFEDVTAFVAEFNGSGDGLLFSFAEACLLVSLKLSFETAMYARCRASK